MAPSSSRWARASAQDCSSTATSTGAHTSPPERAIRSQVKRATGQKMSAAEALARAKRKPRLACATKDAVEYLGTLAVTMVALLDPEAILFGGGTSMPAGLGSDSQLFGALWGVENMIDRPKNRRPAEQDPPQRSAR